MKRHFSSILKFVSIASLLISAAGCSTAAVPEQETSSENETETVALEPEEIALATDVPERLPVTPSGGGDGFSIVMYPDINKETDYYPWNTSTLISEMPVYKKPASSAGVPYGVPKEKMVKLLEKICGRLGFSASSYDTRIIGNNEEGIPYETVIEVSAKTSNAKVSVDGSGEVNIVWDKGCGPTMAPGYNFAYNANQSDAEAAMKYLASKYFFLTDWASYDYDVSGDYTVYGEIMRHYRMWAHTADPSLNIQNYAFRYVEFHPDETGALRSITMANTLEGATLAGNYPLIKPADALSLLSVGYYISNVPFDTSKITGAPRVHLVYRGNVTEEYMIPFYRFYVDVTSAFGGEGSGLRSYGLFDVPAIKDAYVVLPEMPAIGFVSDPEEDPKPTETPATAVYDSMKELKVNRMVQENGYYCGPACAQMILDLFGIKVSQKKLAEQMPVYWPGDRADGVTGSYDSDVARVLSIYLFGAEPKTASDGGYRVQALSNTYSEAAYNKFVERMDRNINDGYPSMIQVDVNTLYGNGKKVNLFVVISGYADIGGVHHYIILDPYYEGGMGGRSIVPAWQLFNSIISSYEPSYLW